jgi:phosphohistidine phosphatase
MKTLTLLRHAKSSWKHPEIDDFERPLNKRGEEDAPNMGRRFAARAARPDAVVASPARRALETARLFCPEMGYPIKKIVEERRIYGTPAPLLLPVIHDLDDAWGHVLLIGHNPALSDLARLLCRYDGEELPTCALVQISFPVEHWWQVDEGGGRCEFVDYPKAEDGK